MSDCIRCGDHEASYCPECWNALEARLRGLPGFDRLREIMMTALREDRGVLPAPTRDLFPCGTRQGDVLDTLIRLFAHALDKDLSRRRARAILRGDAMDEFVAHGKSTCTLAEGKLDVEVHVSLFPVEVLIVDDQYRSGAVLKLTMRYGRKEFKSADELFSPETRAQLGTVLVEALYQTVKDCPPGAIVRRDSEEGGPVNGEPEYDPELHVTAAELRVVGVPVPENIPGPAWILRSSIRAEVVPREPMPKEIAEGKMSATVLFYFAGPWRWVEATIAIPKEATRPCPDCDGMGHTHEVAGPVVGGKGVVVSSCPTCDGLGFLPV